ncbi:hypothetical protein GCM10027034_13090 [Ramlibacter solisilvae]|uniref:Uncharacterized protein n=1 Tax=Ramlibacter tataouinensis TaxID=94132 RepID=A0A127JWQ9_9BURK|nr:hypothetical protein [Ramlibacter tataouinensis]AMO24427.1 hypothetical protein UC35_18275 [Ramlibacter tataouinensis]
MLHQVLNSHPATARAEAARLLLCFAGLATLTLALPWFVPVQPARSTSYMQGFSNPALWVLVVVALIAPTYRLFRAAPPGSDPSGACVLPGPEAQARLRSWAWAACLVFGSYFLAVSHNLSAYMDAEYLLLRMQLVEAGKVPYRDFEYAYGPLLLYAPVALHQLGIPASPSHALLVALQMALGYFALHWILRRLLAPTPAGWLFSCVVLATVPGLLLGTSTYTYLRFAAPAALACFVLLRTEGQRALAASALTGPLFIATWSISPEVAIAAGFAYAVMSAVSSQRLLASSALSALSLAVCVAVIPLVTDSYLTLLEFGGGGNNIPAYPGLHIVFFLFCIFLATAHIATSPIRRSTLDWYVFLYSVALIPGALGRCDPIHLVFYGWGFVALAAKYCLRRWPSGPAFSRFCIAYMWLFLVSWVPYLASIKVKVALARTAIAVTSALQALVGTPLSQDETALAFVQADSWGIPAVPGQAGEVFIIPPRSDIPNAWQFATHFVGLENSTSSRAYARLSEQIRGKRVLIAPETAAMMCEPTGIAWALVMFPTGIFEARHNDKQVAARFCAQLRSARWVARHGLLDELEVPRELPLVDELPGAPTVSPPA